MRSEARHHWRVETTAGSGTASEPIILPRRIDGVTAVVVPGGGGSAYLEYSLSDAALILDDPNSALWIPWESGSVVTATARALNGPVIGVRVQAVGATATLQVAAWTDF